MFDKFISTSTVQSIKDAMTPVALAIGKGAEYGWTILIKQQYVYGVGFAIAAVGSLVLMALFIWMFRSLSEAAKDSTGFSRGDYDFLIAFAFLASVACLICIFAFAFQSAAHFINPDYYALQYLLDTVTNK